MTARATLAPMFNPSPSVPLSEADALDLVHYGRNIMQDTLALIVESIFLSAYGIFFAWSIYMQPLWFNGPLTLPKNFEGLHYFLMVPNVPIGDRLDLADQREARYHPAHIAFYMFNMIIGDGVVIWRTWAVYQRRIAAILIPSILLLASFVFAIIGITCSSYTGSGVLPGAERICPSASLIVWSFCVGANTTCTVLIGFKAWQHHKMMKGLNIIWKSTRMSTEKILLLLVESGFIYLLLWLCQVLAYINLDRTSPWWWVFSVSGPMGAQIAGMYPTLIIVIINFHRTIWEDSTWDSTSTIGNLDGVDSNTTLEWENRPGPRPTDTFNTEHGSKFTSSRP
ncbi:hypothetical protein MVEN_02436100 [Mycena venus]|uniref:Uncharacterized protein n=1 Tax=Mycena venus TaxID=2733690 RepID=A0A8H6WYD4_9AGAR|nr:hypothetical protein MVEN_02436100 [Mycena venus]